MEFSPASEGETAGLVVFGFDYEVLGLRRVGGKARLVLLVNRKANQAGTEVEVAGVVPKDGQVFLRVTVAADAICRFAYSFDNSAFTPIGEPFKASVDRWMGAKVGLIATGKPGSKETGHADFDWFRVKASAP